MIPYTVRERILLAQFVRDHPIIENKRTDGATLADKKAAWEVVANGFKADPDCSTPRTAEQLKKLWSNLKQRKRKETTDARHEMLMTGGGPPKKVELDPVLQVVSEAAPFMDVSMVCPWDSNSIYEKELMGNSASCSTMQVPDADDAEAVDSGLPSTSVASPYDVSHAPVNTPCRKRRSVIGTVKTEGAMRVSKVAEAIKQQAELHSLQIKVCEAQLQERQIAIKKAEAEMRKAVDEAELARLKLEEYKRKML